MSQAFVDAIVKSVSHECSAAAQFIALAQAADDPGLMQAFLTYSREELGHALGLMDYLRTRYGHAHFHLKPEVYGPYDDLYLALVEYIAEEESAIFYYESLASLAPDQASKDFFNGIRQEEIRHRDSLRAIIKDYLEGQA